ncbi:hypothetical protein GALMADRAFT_787374 [Galerina marginata CBS 339.88]|uniref:Uncharacterized protein n=1 Tax=Galerina marginata (strain CBS 339.88) TaxID=685588 RepID=A0A067SUZ5_GALM3|nr:hypothetical protein GALMADRAFT_787374 [Galerina marginata CBS 339.88]
MLCPLSGIAPGGGPTCLVEVEDLDAVSTAMASEILSYGDVPHDLTLQDLASIVLSALEHGSTYDLDPKLPDGISDWVYFDPVGIGHFDESEGGCCPVDERGRCPDGRGVEVRRLDQYNGYGRFYGVLVDDAEREGGLRSEWKNSICRSSGSVVNCNFFVMRGCLEYLRVWLDPSGSLPPRVAFMDSAPLMSLEAELYEIINSRHEIQGEECHFPSYFIHPQLTLPLRWFV